jgi:hypothetical protein
MRSITDLVADCYVFRNGDVEVGVLVLDFKTATSCPQDQRLKEAEMSNEMQASGAIGVASEVGFRSADLHSRRRQSTDASVASSDRQPAERRAFRSSDQLTSRSDDHAFR